tara:strand:- start:32 stop:211 length:180 start_codon:yes stop_codon:yes gene_type:complete
MDLVELIMKQAFSDKDALVEKINDCVDIPLLKEHHEARVFEILISIFEEQVFENLSKSK